MILLGVFAGLFVKMIFPSLHFMAYTGIRLLILPLVMGLGYEFIMFAGKHDNFLTRAMSAPGLWVQRLTTKEPTEDMLEVAIISIKCALRDDFPEFMEFYNERPWEKKENTEEAVADGNTEKTVTEKSVYLSKDSSAAAEEKAPEEISDKPETEKEDNEAIDGN